MDEEKKHLESQEDNDKSDELDLGSILGGLIIGGAVTFGAYQLGKWLLGGEESSKQGRSQKGYELFNLANNFLNNSKFQEAEEYARQCLYINPNNPDFNNLLAAILYYRNKNLDEALALSKKAIQYASNEYTKGLYSGTQSDIHFLRGNWLEAIKFGKLHLDILIKHNYQPFPPSLWSIWRLAISYANSRKFKEAENLYRQALNLEPANPNRYSLHSGMAYVKSELELYNDSIEHYNKAIELLERNSYLDEETKKMEISNNLNGLGVLHKKIGELEKCKEYYSKSAELCSSNPFPFVNLAGIFSERADLKNVRYCLEQAIKVIDLNNKQHHDLVSHSINDNSFIENKESYQIVLSLFRSNNLITEQMYRLKSTLKMDEQNFYISESSKDELKKMIGNDDLKPAIVKLLEHTKEKKKFYNEVMMHLGNLTKIEAEVRIGILNTDEENIQKSKIRFALLGIIDIIK